MKEFKSFFKKVEGNEGDRCHYPTRLDTYGCGCGNNCSYCLDPNTLIMLYDGSVKKLSEIEVGDELYGVERRGNFNYYVKTTVLNKWTSIKPSYKIILADGRELICSGDHRWLSNRGWKYTTGKMTGEDRRPYLTKQNYLLGLNQPPVAPKEITEDYMKGYLSGVIRGDGNLATYDYSGKRRSKDIQYHFRLAMKDESIVKKAAKYLEYFGIEYSWFDFPMIDRKTRLVENRKSIRSAKKESYDKINTLIEWKDSVEYRRGFLAGIYDAEGSTNKRIKRIYNSDLYLITTAARALEEWGIKCHIENHIKKGKNKDVYSLFIEGGISEAIRTRQIFDIIPSKSSIDGTTLKATNLNTGILSIEKYKDNQELIDITTTSENFIANGIVSHNCYAKSLLNFRNLWNPADPAIANIDKIKRTINKKIQPGEVIRLGGMTDCFQKREEECGVTYETIKALNEKRVHYLIVTKNADLASSDKYMAIYDKDLAHIQVSITNTDIELGKRIEPGAPSYIEKIKGVEKLQAAGFDVTVRLSPYIPDFVDIDIINNIKCDKILVEFLRVNTWIEKWLTNLSAPVDLSKYTLKQSGYKHLPLETKMELLKKIKNFKEVSVCEDVEEHWHYWQENFNCNKNDCCNLRLK